MNKNFHQNQRGSASTKMLVVAVILGLLGHAAYNYVPVAYGGENFKQEMHVAVLNGSAIPLTANPVEVTKNRLLKFARDNSYPANVVVDAKLNGGIMSSTARYSQEVNILPFGLYKLTYSFDNTSTPAGFITK
jgi:hypothetical protein